MNFDDEGYDYHGMWNEDAVQDIALNERDAALYEEKKLKKRADTEWKKSWVKNHFKDGQYK